MSSRCASPRLRASVAIVAIGLSAILVVRVAAAAGEVTRLVALGGVVALVFQAMAVTRWPAFLGVAGATLGVLIAASVLPAANRGAVVEFVVLFLAATEMAAWAGRLRSVVPESAASTRRQLGEIGAVVAVGGLVSAGILNAARVNGPDGRIALLVGLVAAVVPVALLVWRPGRRDSVDR